MYMYVISPSIFYIYRVEALKKIGSHTTLDA